jgi:hypothetical protein
MSDIFRDVARKRSSCRSKCGFVSLSALFASAVCIHPFGRWAQPKNLSSVPPQLTTAAQLVEDDLGCGFPDEGSRFLVPVGQQ